MYIWTDLFALIERRSLVLIYCFVGTFLWDQSIVCFSIKCLSCKLRTLVSDTLKTLFVFVIVEVWIWRDWRPEASRETEEGCVRKPSSCIYTPHTCLWGQGGRRGREICCRIGGKLKHGLRVMLIISSIGCCSMSGKTALFLLFMLHQQSATGFCAHSYSQADMLTIITTCSSSRCHMSPCPWHWECPKITYCSITHIVTQGSQIIARQMDPDGCLDCVWDGLPEICWSTESTKTDFDYSVAVVFLSHNSLQLLNLPFPSPAIWESPAQAHSAPSPFPAR